jgi:hypothetical protein
MNGAIGTMTQENASNVEPGKTDSLKGNRNPEKERFLFALKVTLDSKHQLLPYLREQILLETELYLNKLDSIFED